MIGISKGRSHLKSSSMISRSAKFCLCFSNMSIFTFYPHMHCLLHYTPRQVPGLAIASKNRSMSKISAIILLALIFFFSSSMSTDAQFEDYCIADEQVTEDELMKAMKWACSNGADCSANEVDQMCFFPNTTKDHASYAFNNYYQNMKHKGGSCYFIAAAVLTGLDPSHDSCKFEYFP